VAKLLPTLGSREVTPGSRKVAPFDIAVQVSKKGAKGSKMRRKQCPKWVMVVANYDDGNDEKAYGSDMEYFATAACSGKCQTWPPIDQFERLLEEACLNHAYPVKHKLKVCDMMKNFMTSGSLTQGREPEEDPSGSDAMPFPRKDAVMMVYDGRTPLDREAPRV
jgi:hypothetical protein